MWSIATIVCITGLNSMISQWIISFIFGGFFPEEYYKETGVNLTSEELRAEMSKRLPNIKRWKQKINTAHVQYDLIIRVQEYINRHLFDDP